MSEIVTETIKKGLIQRAEDRREKIFVDAKPVTAFGCYIECFFGAPFG
jgi:hypothetical protein